MMRRSGSEGNATTILPERVADAGQNLLGVLGTLWRSWVPEVRFISDAFLRETLLVWDEGVEVGVVVVAFFLRFLALKQL